MKDKSAVALGKKRWSTLTDAESSEQHSGLIRGFWAGKTPEERSAITKERWRKRKSNQKEKS